jgi:hypothetical protein
MTTARPAIVVTAPATPAHVATAIAMPAAHLNEVGLGHADGGRAEHRRGGAGLGRDRREKNGGAGGGDQNLFHGEVLHAMVRAGLKLWRS